MLRSFNGKSPRVHPTAFISEFAYLVGDIEIGPYASIWPGVVLRADCGKITVGENTNIQDGSVVHGDGDVIIGDNVTLGHGVICHASSVGSDCLLGNNCTLNDGAIVGDHCIIASAAMVLEHRKIPPRSFVVGVPAQVKGEIQCHQLEIIKTNAKAYVSLGQQHKEQGLE
jgi:carbonic anhydrase/acetyltransferase-like protein (isoleucine patch superfamily)